MAHINNQADPLLVPNEDALVAAAINNTKIPDPIKQIEKYSGDKTSLFTWISTVESVMETYQQIAHLPIYRLWGQVIRNKIIGDADKALVTHNAVDWPAIKQVLIENFGDKRDIATITQKIPYLSQANKSLDEYYQETSELVAQISQKLSLDPDNDGHVPAIMRVMTPLVVTGFVDGLRGNLPELVRTQKPTDMLEAYRSALAQSEAQDRQRERARMSRNFQTGNFQNSPRFQRINNQRSQPPQNRSFQNPQQNFQRAPPQNFQQNQPQNSSWQNRNFNPINQRPNSGNNAGNAINPRTQNIDEDTSMRSRRSGQPMSGISYRSHINNAECVEEEDDFQPEYEAEEGDVVIDDLNFQLGQVVDQGT